MEPSRDVGSRPPVKGKHATSSLLEVHEVSSEKVLDAADGCIFELCRTLCDPNREVIERLWVDLQPLAILVEKNQQSGDGDAFVAILKRVVLGHKIEEHRCLGDERRIRRRPCKPNEQSEQAAFQYVGESRLEVGDRLIE